ncbi:MAG TPA: hypothetical protein VFG54_04940 [Prolixibacteraceae bacterium]|nr:hypothetical protein [Prolixibacteraceae bacterium]
MNLPLKIAEKLLLIANGDRIPANKLNHPIFRELILEGIIHKPGKTRSIIQIIDNQQLMLFLKNHYSIDDLALYIETLKSENLIRADLVAVATDSKLRYVRTFKGFLANCYSPIHASLNNEEVFLYPHEGTFNFIYDYENFIPDKDITIVGIENPENFRHITRQKYLFENIQPLFVSRYPQYQSKDLIKWLQSIPNNYMHFGDFDFAGIGIYLNEYKKYLDHRANLFIPDNIDSLIRINGSKKRYDDKRINFNLNNIEEEKIIQLIESIHRNKKGLDQEIFIKAH